MNVIGIDPGQTGAIALLVGEEQVVWDMPADTRGFRMLISSIYDVLTIATLHAVFIEHVHSMPKQGVSSSFKFGVNFGMVRMFAEMLGAPVYLVTPQKWQKAVLDSENKEAGKERSLLFARRRWPKADLKLKKHNGRADALCIAEYGRITLAHEVQK